MGCHSKKDFDWLLNGVRVEIGLPSRITAGAMINATTIMETLSLPQLSQMLVIPMDDGAYNRLLSKLQYIPLPIFRTVDGVRNPT
jgi:hypothetical protein